MSNIYHIKFDQDGYIIDMSKFPAAEDYIPTDIGSALIPPKIMRGYYKWAGTFIVDGEKEAVVDAEFALLEE